MPMDSATSQPTLVDSFHAFMETKTGRFANRVAFPQGTRHFSKHRGLGLHAAGMNELYQGFGVGRYGVLNFATYNLNGKGIAFARDAGKKAGSVAIQKAALARLTAEGSRRAFAGQAVMRSLAPALTAYYGYQGFKEGGIGGAVSGVATSAAGNYIAGVAFRALGALGLPTAVAGAAVAGTYYSLKMGNARTQRTRSLEMGSPVVDPFGNAATMRQRSLQALMNSPINGRSAFGSEAQLLHVPTQR